MPLSFNKDRLVIISIAVSFFVRLIFSVWPSFDNSLSGTDLSTYRQWSLLLTERGFFQFYEKAEFFPYPPVANYLFFVLGRILKFLNQPLNGGAGTLLFKLPNITGDILTAFLLFKMVQKKLSFKGVLIFLNFYLWQPAAFFITTIWGQWDGIMTFFLVFAFYNLGQKNLTRAFLSFLMGVLIKPQALPFVFAFLAMALKDFGIKKFLLSAAITSGVTFLLFYPFFSSSPITGMVSYARENLKTFPPRFTSSAFNFWYLLYGGWQDKFPLVLGIPARALSRWLIMGFLLPITYLSFRRKNIEDRVLLIGLSGYVFYLFFTQIHERYFYAVVPFLLLGLVLQTGRIKYFWMVLLALVFALNSIGFYIGWINFGLWNSTFLTNFGIDKIVAIIYLLGFAYIFSLVLFSKQKNEE